MINIVDATSGVASSSVALDGIAVSKGDIIDLRNLSIGSHIIRVIAADNAGNNAESSTTFIVKPLRAIIKIEPQTLNMNSSGKWIQAEIEIPGYKTNQINISSIRLNGIIPVAIRPDEVKKDDKDDKNKRDDSLEKDDSELKFKFNMTLVQSIISPGPATLYISGKVNEAAFMGNYTIRVIENHEKDSDHSEKNKSEEPEKIAKSKGKGG